MGPAIEPSLVTCPTRTTAIPSPLANSISRTAASRTWPTLPAAPSSSSTVAVWIESTTTRAGRADRATSTIRSDVVLGEDRDRLARRRRPAGPGARPGAGPAPPTPRRWRTGRAPPTPAATWSSSVDLPMPGSPPSRISEPGTMPPPRTRSSSPMPVGRRGTSRSPMSARATELGRRPPGPAGDAGRLRGVAHDGLDEAVPGAAGAALALPAQERLAAALADEAARGLGHGQPGRPVEVKRPRRARATRRRGCPGRPRGPCPRRSSCRARSGRAAGARRARPRSCSG